MTADFRVGIIVQARISSTRLPGKALLALPLGGSVTLLEQVLTRARRAATVTRVVVALPDNPADDPLAALAEAGGVAVFRGPEADVLQRFALAAAAFDFDVIVRLTADNPALDPRYVDEAVRAHLANAADYTLTTGLPLGLNVEVISRAALLTAAAEATDSAEREHVTPFIRRRPERFRLLTLPLEVSTEAAALRMTVDYPTDYALQQLLYTTLGPDFGLPEVLRLFAQHPWLTEINGANQQIRV